MPPVAIARLLLLLTALLPHAVLAAQPPTPANAGVTINAALAMPAKPIATREQLDAYLRDTPAEKSPLNWLTPGARRRFLDSLVFGQHGLGGMSLDDLTYELTREQAYTLLQLFGKQSYALNLDARRTPRPASDDATTSSLEPAYDRLVAEQGDGSATQARTIARLYAEGFAAAQNDTQRRALGNRDAEFLFRAATFASLVTGEPAYLADVRRDFAELERRRLVDRPHASNFHDVLVNAHQMDEARALLASHPLIERNPLPAMRTASRIREGQPSLWVATPETRKRELVRFRFNLRAPAQVVVVASTSCHFSVNAARDLQADPLLRDIFREYAQWVAPPSEITAFDAVRDWNRTYTAMRLGIAYDRSALPMVERIETPTFYFLDHGTVVDTVVGWPAGGNIDAIRRGLRRINLLR